MRQEAYELYIKERNQVDGTVNKMVQEDLENLRLQESKKAQFQQDMILSQEEKIAMV